MKKKLTRLALILAMAGGSLFFSGCYCGGYGGPFYGGGGYGGGYGGGGYGGGGYGGGGGYCR